MRSDSPAGAFLALVFARCVPLAVLLLGACSEQREEAAKSKPEVQGETIVFPADAPVAQRLATEKVRPPSEVTLQLPGRLVWDEERTVRVFPPFAGRVTRLLAKPGDRVAKGQPLAEISSPDFAQAGAETRKAEADLALARKSLERQRALADNGLAAGKDVQQAEADEARARAESARAGERIKAFGHVGGGSGSAFLLRTPVAGIVVDRNLNPGQELRPELPGAPLFVVTDPTRLWVQLDAHEAEAGALKPGMLLVISSTQIPDDAFAGELRQVADFVDPATRTVKLRGDVANASRQLRAEMFVSARVKLPAGERPTVDGRAVYLAGSRRYVFVREAPERYVRRVVRVGPEVEGRMPVYSGLKDGEEVVVSGMLFLEQILTSTHPASAVPASKAPASAQ